MELNEIENHAQKILQGLVEYHLEQGYQSEAYNDPETGGIYEHKLATRLGYQLITPGDFPPQDFMAAIQILEAKGYIKRNKRKDDYPIMGVRPTPNGILEYQKLVERTAVESETMNSTDNARVFVVHGRNEELRKSMFDFLRSIGLKPIEWTQAIQMTGETAPFIGDILDAAFQQAQAVVVLLNGDDEARLRPEYHSAKMPEYERNLTPQARPNVIFEAGLALGRFPTRTIIVEVGDLRPFSDIAGRHTIRLNNSTRTRQDVAQRLALAGCKVDLSGTDWHQSGNFEIITRPITQTPQTFPIQPIKEPSSPGISEVQVYILLDLYRANRIGKAVWELTYIGSRLNVPENLLYYALVDLESRNFIVRQEFETSSKYPKLSAKRDQERDSTVGNFYRDDKVFITDAGVGFLVSNGKV